jgi:hypothetical protein
MNYLEEIKTVFAVIGVLFTLILLFFVIVEPIKRKYDIWEYEKLHFIKEREQLKGKNGTRINN